MRKNHQGTVEFSVSQSGAERLFNYFVGKKMFQDAPCPCQGASGIVTRSPNGSKSLGVTPLVMMDYNISMGLSNRNLAVLMMVMASTTFILPCSVRLPKVIFLKIALSRISVSAKLFVGLTTGYFRKTNSSFLWGISRVRIGS